MKKIILIFFLLLVCNNIDAQKKYDLDWTVPGYRGEVKISWATVHKDGWHQWWEYIKAENNTDQDLVFVITYRICRVKLISKKDKLSDTNCSEIETLQKFIPAHTTIKLFDPKNWDEQLPYLKPIGNLPWGFDIIEFDVYDDF